VNIRWWGGSPVLISYGFQFNKDDSSPAQNGFFGHVLVFSICAAILALGRQVKLFLHGGALNSHFEACGYGVGKKGAGYTYAVYRPFSKHPVSMVLLEVKC